MLNESAKKIGKEVSNKAKQIYEDKQMERDIYREELKKEKLKQIKLKAKQKAKDKYNPKQPKLFDNTIKKEYF